MPNGKEKRESNRISPSPSLLRRLLGGPISERVQENWPELANKWALMESSEMPHEAAATNRVRSMNFIEKYLEPRADAITWPWGTIALNKELIGKNKADIGDILAHELTHVGQRKKSGLMKHWAETITAPKEYLARPHEQEALEAETRRPVRHGDIRLPIR